MIDKVLETYKCLLSCRKRLPGMKLEDAFSEDTIKEIEKEYKWLKDQADVIYDMTKTDEYE